MLVLGLNENTGLTFAQGFADSQGVATYGYNG